MEGFLAWLVLTEDRARVPPGVLRGDQLAFKDQLQRVIHRTQNPALRAELEDMLHCPIRDARGNCKSFTNYIVGTLVKNGVHARYDLEAALAYVVEKMLMEEGRTRRATHHGLRRLRGASRLRRRQPPPGPVHEVPALCGEQHPQEQDSPPGRRGASAAGHGVTWAGPQSGKRSGRRRVPGRDRRPPLPRGRPGGTGRRSHRAVAPEGDRLPASPRGATSRQS